MKLTEAIYKLYPQVVRTVDADNPVAYDVEGREVPYDPQAVEAYVASQAYKSQRASDYPSFADQFDLLYHGGFDAWKQAIDAVKLKYPKPTEEQLND